jgi:glycosyltransferase involved in cell wall biosynthesis
LRILIIAPAHPERSAGGTERASYLLFSGLRGIGGVRPYFLAGDGPRDTAEALPAISCFADRPDEFLLSAGNFDDFQLSRRSPAAIAAFVSLLEDLDPEVVHFHHYLNIGLEFVAAVRRTKPTARIVLTLHDYRVICHHHGLMVKTRDLALCNAASGAACAVCFEGRSRGDFAARRRFVRACLEDVDIFVSPSAFLKQRYVAWGLPAERIAVQDNGVAPMDKPPAPPSSGGAHRVFGYFGQIHPFKGLHCLLAAFDRLCRTTPSIGASARLVIHGAHLEDNHPDYVAGFRRAVAENPGSVAFAGAYEYGELPVLMEAVDWVIVPSIWWENSPLVIQEAFANRRPVICADIGGMAEKVRPGLDGFHFRVGDPAALAAVMAKVAADGRIWDSLQSTLCRPVTIDEAIAGHLGIYGAAGL